MKKIVLSISLLLAGVSPALALSDAGIPTKVPTTWGTSAPGGNITCPMPIPSQIGITPGRASWTDGFPPVTFLPAGIPPYGQDFNGVLCQLSQWTRWQNAGAAIPYDATFQTAVGGYPRNAVIGSLVNSFFWLSTADNNTSDPETGGANWQDLYLTANGATWAGTASGVGNAQTLTLHGWLFNMTGVPVQFFPVAANTGSATLQINGVGSPITIKKRTINGLVALTGGELNPTQATTADFDGTVFEISPPPILSSNIIQITASGTYTPTSGTVYDEVKCRGGGGAGGGASATGASQGAAGGGGGSGGEAFGIFPIASLLPNVSVTIGAGGVGSSGATGGSGGSTFFGSLLAAGGAAGGGGSGTIGSNTIAIASAGAAGLSTGNTPPIVQYSGQPGLNGFIFNLSGSPTAVGGGGAPGLEGLGGAPPFVVASGGGAGSAAIPGTGAGGGGAVNLPSQASPQPGGAGGSGVCIVQEFLER
jgi:hypothetical protein